MNNEQYIEDLKVMIEADKKHLIDALDKGNRAHAHEFVDAIIENTRRLQARTRNT